MTPVDGRITLRPGFAKAMKMQPSALIPKAGSRAIVGGNSSDSQEQWGPFFHKVTNPDGTVTDQIFSGPTFHRLGTTWLPIDPSLTQSSDPTLPVAAENMVRPVRFGSSSAKMMVIALDGGPITLSDPSLSNVVPSLDSSGVHYDNIAPHTDINYSTSASGVVEQIVLRSPASPTSFTFHLADPTGQLGQAVLTPAQGYVFTGEIADGESLRLPAPHAWVQPAAGQPPVVQTNTATLSVVTSGDGFDITTAVNPAWLATQTYPVILDPSILFGGAYTSSQPSNEEDFSDTYWNPALSQCGGTSGGCAQSGTDANLPIGAGEVYGSSPAQYYTHRSYLWFNIGPIPEGSLVSSATLGVTSYQCDSDPPVSCDGQYPDYINVHPLTEGNWGPSWTYDQLSSITSSTVWDANDSSSYWSDYGSQSLTWNLTAGVQGWVNNYYSDYGLALEDADEYNIVGGPFAYSTYYGPYQSAGNPPSPSNPNQYPYLEVTYSPTYPCAPTSPSASATDGGASVSWYAPSCNGGSPLANYTVIPKLYNGSSWTYETGQEQSVSCSSSPCSTSFAGLTVNGEYEFAIYANNQAGYESGESDTGPVYPYGPPGNPPNVAASAGNASATVTWGNATANSSAISSYTAQAWIAATNTEVASQSCLCNGLTFSGLTNGTPYYFTVYATNAAGPGPQPGPESNTVTPATIPTAPLNVTAVPSDTTAEVTWQPPSSNGGATITGYTVVCTDTTNPANCPTAHTNATSPDPWSGLTGGDYYYFTVYANNSIGQSPGTSSNTVQVTSVPCAPTGPGVALGNESATLRWSAPSCTGGLPITSYTARGEDNTTNTAISSQTVTASPASFSGLTPGDLYTFSVAANNADGQGAAASAAQIQAITVPGLPTQVQAVGGNASATMSWDPPTYTGYSAVSSYTVGGTDTTTNQAVPTQSGITTTTASFTGLNNGDSYTFWVAANNAAGAGNQAYTSPVVPASVPGPPQNVVGQAGNTFVSLSWSAPASNGGSALTGYSIQAYYAAGVNQGTTWGSPISAPSTSATVSGLTNGQAYYFAISAVNSVGAGPPTDSATLTPEAPTPGLGLESWWTTTDEAIGPQADAQVNVGNGNLLLTQTDTTPVNVHGRLGLVVRRVFNSQDDTTVSLPGSFGAGWLLNVGQADDLASVGLTATALSVQSGEKVASPLSVTVISRDGSHDVYEPRALVTPLAVASLPTSLASLAPVVLQSTGTICIDQTYTAPAGIHVSLWRYVSLPAGSGLVCANPGAWPTSGTTVPTVLGFGAERTDRVRYEYDATGHLLDMSDGSGTDLRYLWGAVSGISTSELMAVYEGRSCVDSAGVAPTGPSDIPSTCRALHFAYDTSLVGSTTLITEVDLTDSAHRLTKYLFDSASPQHLTAVVNPDGSKLVYNYGTCGGSVNGSPDANLLCSASDPRGNATTFAYTSTPIAQVSAITDRAGNVSSYSYLPGATTVDRPAINTSCSSAPSACESSVYRSIDSALSVGEIDAGSAAGGYWTHQSLFTWDNAGTTTCRAPDAVVDNDLCDVYRVSGYLMNPNGSVVTSGGNPVPSPTPAEDTRYTYNDEGQQLSESRSTGTSDLVTTDGYQAEYFEATTPSSPCAAGADVICYNDTVAGNGSVSSGSGPRGDAATLFVISDRTQSLPPRGNDHGAAYASFLTTYHVDDNPAEAPNQVEVGGFCGPSSYNSGSMCETDAPASVGTQPASGCAETRPTPFACTLYTYDSFGQRLTETTPLSMAANPAGPVTYSYVYYTDFNANTGTGDLDLSGTVSAGGWLKGICDPLGYFVAFGYDAAGNQVRSFDRNATAGASGSCTSALAAYASDNASTPPSGSFTESDYASGSTAYSAPWRYVVSSRDQLGDTTTYTLDGNGNRTRVRSPRGNLSGNANYDVVESFDRMDRLASRLLPTEAASGKATTYTYDAYGNQTALTDPNGHVTAYAYDSVNRQIARFTTRGPAGGSIVSPTSCHTSGQAGDPASLPANRITCVSRTAYDGVDNKVATQDANGAVSYFAFDGVHRQVGSWVPRDSSTLLYTETSYDSDGNPTDVCPPRQFTEGGSTPASAPGATPVVTPTLCSAPAQPTSSAYFGTHRVYDLADRLVASSSFRQTTVPACPVSGTQACPLTTSYAYDADGNQDAVTDPNGNTTNQTFDLNDRRISQSVPRSGSGSSTVYETTTWSYDPSGDVSAVSLPAPSGTARITAYSYDAAHRLLDTVVGSDSLTAASAGTATGSGDDRTRNYYDADGNVVATASPDAFATSVSSPNPDYVIRIDYDVDGRPSVLYTPRFDPAASSATDLGSGADPADVQASQCAPTNRPAAVLGSNPPPAYPVGTGVCETTVTYDPAGNRSSLILPTAAGSGSTNRHVDFSYTDDNLVSSVSAPNPADPSQRVNVETDQYDADGHKVMTTDANGNSETTTYFADHLVSSQAAQAYTNSAGSTVAPVTTFAYDAGGDQLTATDHLGHSNTATYFSDGTLQTSSDAVGDKTSYQYDADANPTEVLSPSANARDATNPSGSAAYNAYTEDNLVAFTAVPVATDGTSYRLTSYSYDPAGRKTATDIALVSAPNTSVWPPTFTVTDDAGPQSFSYAANDRLTSENGRGPANSAPDAITYGYAPSGQSTSITDANSGVTISPTYYLDGTTRSVDDGSFTTKYSYDGSGQIASQVEAPDLSGTTFTQSVTLTDAGLPSAMSSPLGTTGFSFDPTGRETTVAQPNGTTNTWGYNPDGTLARASTTASGATLASWSYLYDSAQRITTANYTSVPTQGAGATLSYGYDSANRLTTFTDALAGAAPVTQTATWDADSNRTTYGVTGTSADTTFAYNADNSLSRVTQANTTELVSQDAAGETTQDQCFVYAYDGLGRLRGAVNYTTGAPTCTQSQSSAGYSYDGLGREVGVSYNGVGVDPALHYAGLGTSLAVEQGKLNGGSVVTATTNYELAPGGSPLGLSYTPASGSAATQFLATDGFSDVTTVTSAQAAPVCQVLYDPFGSPIASSSSTSPCLSGTGSGNEDLLYYRSSRIDSTTGSYTFGARTYNPTNGSFLTPDTYTAAQPSADLSVLVDPLTENTYSYVNGDPVNLDDPTGHYACLPGQACAGAAGQIRYNNSEASLEASNAAGASAEAGQGALERAEFNGLCRRTGQCDIRSRLSLMDSYNQLRWLSQSEGQDPGRNAAQGGSGSWWKLALSVGAGTLAGIGCGVVLGVETAGTALVGCAALGGAVSGAVDAGYHCGNRAACWAADVTVGAVTAGATAGLVSFAAPVLSDLLAGGTAGAEDAAGSVGAGAEEGPALYRGMRPTEGGAPEIGASAKTLGARPGIDIPVGEDGLVRPGTGGMSVNDSPTGMPEFRRPPSFGGTAKDLSMYCIDACDLGPGLRYAPDAAGGGHGFMEPAWVMPFEEYQGYLGGTQGSWSEVQP